MAVLKSYPNCFGCGSDNPIGLKLSYRTEGENVVAEFVPREEHQGWPGITHGGIISSLLYEVMENYSYQKGIVAMMRRMETRFRKPISTGETITARSWLVEDLGRVMKVAGSLTDQNDTLLAQGEADLLVLNEDQVKGFGIN